MEFVNSMRKKGQLIMGIGHRVKSVSSQHFLFNTCIALGEVNFQL